MDKQADMTAEQAFFAVFCIEALADDLRLAGGEVYRRLAEDSDILDGYIVPGYEALHTQGREYIVRELKRLMRRWGGAMMLYHCFKTQSLIDARLRFMGSETETLA